MKFIIPSLFHDIMCEHKTAVFFNRQLSSEVFKVISCGIFVTFPQMTTYAASKDSITSIQEQLTRIEHKLDKVMGY